MEINTGKGTWVNFYGIFTSAMVANKQYGKTQQLISYLQQLQIKSQIMIEILFF